MFSNILANIPDYGFYLYRDGQMVWHSNCLPLQVIPLTNGDITSDTPLAVSSSVTALLSDGVQQFYVCICGK
ncbi:Hypothetical protein ABZS17I87_01199 [Kosakonia cowanii]